MLFSMVTFVVIEGTILVVGLGVLCSSLLVALGSCSAVILSITLCTVYIRTLQAALQLIVSWVHRQASLSSDADSTEQFPLVGTGSQSSMKSRSVTFNDEVDSCLIGSIDEAWKAVKESFRPENIVCNEVKQRATVSEVESTIETIPSPIHTEIRG